MNVYELQICLSVSCVVNSATVPEFMLLCALLTDPSLLEQLKRLLDCMITQ